MAKKKPLILEECLLRLDRGENLDEVLADYPDRSEELKLLLLVALSSRAFPIPVPSQAALRLGRNQMLAEMNSQEIKGAFRKRSSIPTWNYWITGLVSQTRTWRLSLPTYRYRLITVLLVIVFSVGFFTLKGSASSQPGELLYVLNQSLERVGLMDYKPAELPALIPSQFELDSGEQEDRLGQFFGAVIGQGEPSPDHDQGAWTDPALQGQERELKEADREAEKDLKGSEKEAGKELKQTEKETLKGLNENEKELNEAERKAEKNLKEGEKETEKDLQETNKDEDKAIKATEQEQKKEDKIKAK